MTSRTSEPGADPSSFRGPDVPVQQVMERHIARASPEATLRQLAEKLASVGVGALLIGSLEEAVGIVTERDLVTSIARGADPDAVTAAQIGSSAAPVRCGPMTTTAEAARLMAANGVRHVLVGDGHDYQGIVSARDLLLAFAD